MAPDFRIGQPSMKVSFDGQDFSWLLAVVHILIQMPTKWPTKCSVLELSATWGLTLDLSRIRGHEAVFEENQLSIELKVQIIIKLVPGGGLGH